MSEKSPISQPEKIPSAKKILRDLTKIFHPDLEGGDKRLMQDLNAAYELASKKGDERKLREMYLEWTSPEYAEKKRKEEADFTTEKRRKEEQERLAKEALKEEFRKRGEIYRIMKQESDKLRERLKKNDRTLTNKQVFSREKYFMELYKQLCQEREVSFQDVVFAYFLFREGWITKERHDELVKSRVYREK